MRAAKIMDTTLQARRINLMKKLIGKAVLICTVLCALSATSFAADAASTAATANKLQSLKIGIVNFKRCVEQSKIGKQEQANFEGLKKQMETVLSEKEKSLNEMATKFNDPDYLDSLSPEAETELKRKFRAQNQELAQLQNQYMQNLQQTNVKIIQKLNELVSKAANTLATKEKLDLVLNEETSFFYAPSLDLSSKVITMLDEDFDKQPKETTKPTADIK
jgi:outer membrane protein